MNKTKLLNPLATPNAPKNMQEWNQFLNRVIRRAEELGDRRLEGLRKAMIEGRAEKILRSMSILSDVDLDREFPRPPTT